MKVKVTNEKFRVYPEGRKMNVASKDKNGNYVAAHPAPYKDYENIMEAISEAFKIAGENKCAVMVDRVTFHEPYEQEWFMHKKMVSETVTGEYRVPFPHFASINISRYNAVNGWCIPDEINIKKSTL